MKIRVSYKDEEVIEAAKAIKLLQPVIKHYRVKKSRSKEGQNIIYLTQVKAL